MATETIRYTRSDYNTKGVLGGIVLNREETYDIDYGTASKPPRTDYKFALLKEGAPEGFIGEHTLLAELRQPKWGPNGNQPFSELIPPLKQLPPTTIPVAEYYWKAYNKDIGQIPTEVGAQYELGLDMGSGWRIITVTFDGTLTVFDVLYDYGLFTHFRKKNVGGFPVQETNPAYAPALAQLNIEKSQLKQLLQETLTMSATHVFPAYPLNDVLTTQLLAKYSNPLVTPYFATAADIPSVMLWKWYKLGTDGKWIDVPISSSHRLASPTGGWKTIRRPVRPTTDLTSQFNSAVDRAVDRNNVVMTPDQKLQKIIFPFG